MNSNERLRILLDLYVSGKITLTEHAELMDLIAGSSHDGYVGAQILLDLQDGNSAAQPGIPPHIAQEIYRNIIKAEKTTARVLPAKKRVVWMSRPLMAVAAVVFLVFCTWVITYLLQHNVSKDIATILPRNVQEWKGDDKQPKVVVLGDGSRVTLQPGSKLYSAPDFGNTNREVFLDGEAFFDVEKDPSRPFFVYYKSIVTRVLGTSFHLGTNATGDVEVAVSTGRVQVFENDKLVRKGRQVPVIVTPNQKVVYAVSSHEFETKLVEKPQPLSPDTEANDLQQPPAFIYQQQSLAAVYTDFEKKYGIEIILENADIRHCVFSGDVSAQDMFTKLQIICLATNCSYEINGTRILIKGPGCQIDKSIIIN